MCEGWGGGVKAEGGLCLYARISRGKLLVCWFNPTPCVEPEVGPRFALPLRAGFDKRMDGRLNVDINTSVVSSRQTLPCHIR